ncbi:PF11026 domain protein [Leptospira interrogans serovar Copenhageni str. LT2050]|uniref:PF11026 domain protein n=1 Tax=Leptospira interrogans serovar Copenhageni str. LT2050 TaxID=1001598 RepID=M3H497_LEPIT|nr:PF11026 domain protein [Leptospira interrogans serovar Copenhageni str. LT2050]
MSLLACTSCLTALAFDFQGIAWSLFGTALFFLVISLCICLLEIHLSVQALDIEMHALYKPNSK